MSELKRLKIQNAILKDAMRAFQGNDLEYVFRVGGAQAYRESVNNLSKNTLNMVERV